MFHWGDYRPHAQASSIHHESLCCHRDISEHVYNLPVQITSISDISLIFFAFSKENNNSTGSNMMMTNGNVTSLFLEYIARL